MCCKEIESNFFAFEKRATIEMHDDWEYVYHGKDNLWIKLDITIEHINVSNLLKWKYVSIFLPKIFSLHVNYTCTSFIQGTHDRGKLNRC